MCFPGEAMLAFKDFLKFPDCTVKINFTDLYHNILFKEWLISHYRGCVRSTLRHRHDVDLTLC